MIGALALMMGGVTSCDSMSETITKGSNHGALRTD
jgi:hypothetical protein